MFKITIIIIKYSISVVHCDCFKNGWLWLTGQPVECYSEACVATSILIQSYTICLI